MLAPLSETLVFGCLRMKKIKNLLDRDLEQFKNSSNGEFVFHAELVRDLLYGWWGPMGAAMSNGCLTFG